MDEARASREAQLASEAARVLDRDARNIEGAANALVGAASDVVQLGSTLAAELRQRTWRIRREPLLRRVELAMQPVTAASRALDELRYFAPRAVVEAAGALFDEIVVFFQESTAGSSDAVLQAQAGRLREAKGVLHATVSDGLVARGT